MNAYEDLARSYEEVRPDFQTAVEEVRSALADRLGAARIDADIHARAKTVESLVKKAVRRSDTSIDQIGDKGGIRVIYTFPGDVDRIETIVREISSVVRKEVKSDGLGFERLGYQGVHLDVVTLGIEEFSESSRGLSLEIQLQTKAENAWASVTHDLFYKSPVEIPIEVKRGFNRLSALAEIFDSEVDRLVDAVQSQPGFETAELIERLDDELVKYTGQRPDQALTRMTASELVSIYDCPPGEVFQKYIEPFLAEHREHIQKLYSDYADDRRYPLLFQPEALIIFERVESDPTSIAASWPAEKIPREMLASLSVVWGNPLPAA